MKHPLAFVAACLLAASSHAQIVISEFMYQGRGVTGDLGFEHEFVELTNIGSTSIDVSGWYYGDSTGPANPAFTLTGFGSIAPGESVIFTDISEADFRTVWSTMSPSVRVLGGAEPGLGRNDTISIFNSSDTLMTSLAYGDQTFSGTPRFRFTTGNTTFANLGADNIAGWFFSDTAQAWNGAENIDNLTSINGDSANPGYMNLAAVPEPGTVALVAIGLGFACFTMRRRMRA